MPPHVAVGGGDQELLRIPPWRHAWGQTGSVAEMDLGDADLRVLHRLKTELDAFDLGLTAVGDLISSISSLLDEFEQLPPALAEELRGVWWPVQYALALSRDQERELTADEELAARDAVALMQGLLSDLDLP